MKETTSIDDIINMILLCDEIERDTSKGADMITPIYEITPTEFLGIAEMGLDSNTLSDKVNSVSNLKRALDYQLDIFLESINLKKIFQKNNLKFEQKTKFLSNIGILSPKSINKLNSIRNKLEHEYKIPTIDDLQVYYELVWSVTEIIDARLLSILANGEISYSLYHENSKFYISILFDIKNSKFAFEIRDWSSKEINEKEYIIIEAPLKNKSDEENYVKAFKIYLATIHFFHDDNLQQYKNNLKNIAKHNE